MIKRLLKWFLVVPVRFVAPLLPVNVLYALGKAGGTAYSLIAARTVKKMKTGFEGLMQGGDGHDPDAVVRRSCQNYIMSELEVFLYGRINRRNVDRFVAIAGAHHLDKALEGGRGVILLHAHFGNAHMLMPGLGHRGYTLNQVGLQPSEAVDFLKDVTFQRPDNLTITWFRLKEEYEKLLPVKFIYLGKSLRPAIECLKRNEIMAISLDGGEGEMIPVSFLSRKAFFLTGPVRLAKVTGAAIVPAFTVRKENGTHQLVIEPQIIFDSVEKGVEQFISLLESYVRKFPCHYVRLLAYDNPPFGGVK